MPTKTKFTLRFTVLAMAALTAHATDTFDPATNRLTLESVTVAGQTYKAVAIQLNAFSVLSVGSGAPVADSFDSNSNVLTMGAIYYQGTIYNNVRVRVDSYNLLGYAPPSTYTGESATAFNVLNAERQTCGFGVLAQNGALDGSASAHGIYVNTNGVFAHEETPGMFGFTGSTPTERMIAKGYAGSVYTTGEVMSGVNGATLNSPGAYAIRNLLSGPYHLRAMVDSYRDVGISFASGGAFGSFIVGDFGYPSSIGPQMMGSGDVNTYPCNGSTGVFPELRSESPNPVPGRDLSVNPIGTPILVRVRDGNTLVIKSTSMIQVSNGYSVTLRPTITAANDPNRVNGVGYIRANEAYFAPDAALFPNTQYQVTITGTNNGVYFSRTFNFMTGVRG